MNKQICRACGNEIQTESVVPMTFCTNCGASLAPPTANNLHGFGAARSGSRRSTTLNKGEKLIFGSLIAVPVILILGGIGAFALLFYAALNIDKKPRRYATPTPFSTPKKVSNLLLTVGSDGLGQGQFKNARALALDKNGNIYVGDGSQRVQKFDAAGRFLQSWNVRETTVTNDEKYLKGVTNLAIDSRNRLYVVVDKKDLLRYDASGKFIDRIALYGEKWSDKQQEARILDAVMLPDDKLAVYATSFPDGEYLMLVSSDGKSEIKHKNLLKKQENNPATISSGSLLINPAGDIFLLNGSPTEKPYVYRFKSDGGYVDRFTWESDRTAVFFAKKLLAMSSKGEIYVFNSVKKQINVLSSEGVLKRSVPVEATSFENIAIDANDNIFILKAGMLEKYSGTSN